MHMQDSMEYITMLDRYQLAPDMVLAYAGVAVALAVVLYLVLDAISYRRIPELSIPLRSGAFMQHSSTHPWQFRR